MEELFKTTRESCSARTWSRGVELARGGAVVLIRRDAHEAELRVAVPGQTVSPTVTLWPADEDWSCDCTAAEDPCTHVAAAVIALKRKTAVTADTAPSTAPRREGGAPVPAVASQRQIVGYRLSRSAEGLRLQRVLVSGGKETPLTSSVIPLASGRGPGARVAASKQDLTAELALGQRVRGGLLPRTTLQALLGALRDGADLRLDGSAISVGPARAAVRAELRDDGPGFRLQARRDPGPGERFANGAVLEGSTLHPLAEPTLPAAELRTLLAGQHYPPAAAGQLAMVLLPRLAAQIPLSVETRRLPDARAEPPRLVVEVSRDHDRLRVVPTLVYGNPPRARLDGVQMTLIGAPDRPVPLRDEPGEQRLRERLWQRFELRLGRPQLLEPAEAMALVGRLSAARDVELVGTAQREFFQAGPLQPRFAADETGFSLSFTCEGARAEVQVSAEAVLRAWHEDRALLGLPGGGFAALPHDWLSRYGHHVAALMALRQPNSAKLAPAALPDLARLCEELNAPTPPSLGRLRDTLQDFTRLEPPTLPHDLQAELRSYQREGVAWLSFTRENQLGALLADDMGLGKTLQACCVLQRGQRSLVIAPTSVLGNWQSELARFRPGLRCAMYYGANRRLDQAADVILTSYALLRLDIERLAALRWDTVVLDESQNIRNPESQVAQAAFRLDACWRVALSGTPIENRLDDLWSQFHFLNRGLLGGRGDFSDRYARPIAGGQTEVAADLRRRTRPFILRRLKQQVERQLPPRTEVVLRCQLTTQEREIYDAIRASTRREVLQQLQLGKNVLAALAALLRLRQAACHGALVPGQQAATSSKLSLLIERLQETTAEGHKALVFSQWTSLLDLIEPALAAEQISYLRLDGSTRDRQEVVSRFQRENGPPVLLISLKAGGVGLNLTEADYVFMMDPWWNPATEDQAADRAHRIGQTKPVIVHKLVSEDTVEERILALQGTKRALARAALDGAELAAALTRDDLLELLQ